jgi:hypothetical protein
MRWSLHRGAVTFALACTTAVAMASPTDALAAGGVVTVCTGGMRMVFTTSITGVPRTTPNTLALTTPAPLVCTGLFSGSASIAVPSMATAPGTACTTPLVATATVGSVTLSGPFGIVQLALAAVGGTTVAPAWTLLSTVPPLLATGGGAWIDQGEIQSCASTGVTTVDTFAVIVIVA